MYKVYATESVSQAVYAFDYEDLVESLDAVAQLRSEGYSFVTMVSENPDCVSLIGANGMDAKDYEWKKRR